MRMASCNWQSGAGMKTKMEFARVLILLAVFLNSVTVSSLQKLGQSTELVSLKATEAQRIEETGKDYPFYLSGLDRNGRPVWVVELGKWDVRKAVDQGGSLLENLESHMNASASRMMHYCKEVVCIEGEPLKGSVLLVDMDGYSWSQFTSYSTVSFLSKKGKELRGVLCKVEVTFVLNAGFVARSLLKIFKPIIGNGGTDRVQVFGTDKSTWATELLKYVPADQLVEKYGGTKNLAP